MTMLGRASLGDHHGRALNSLISQWNGGRQSASGFGRSIALEGPRKKLMNMQRTIFAAAGIAFLSAGTSFAQQVKTDYDHKADFSQYRTFSFEKVQTADPLLVDRIKSAITTTLMAKGWMQVPSGGNVAIVAMDINKEHQTLNTYYDGFGGGWRWGGGFGDETTTVDHYEVGTLVVDLFDAKSKQLLWRGSTSETLSSKPENNTKNLDKGVQKMFDHFPPSSKK
jgi:hypothetical protein